MSESTVFADTIDKTAIRLTIRAYWHDKHGEWVGVCNEYSRVTYRSADRAKALAGIASIVAALLEGEAQ